jgi:hypothetical protein
VSEPGPDHDAPIVVYEGPPRNRRTTTRWRAPGNAAGGTGRLGTRRLFSGRSLSQAMSRMTA